VPIGLSFYGCIKIDIQASIAPTFLTFPTRSLRQLETAYRKVAQRARNKDGSKSQNKNASQTWGAVATIAIAANLHPQTPCIVNFRERIVIP
jgi:hypothetical protein